MANIVVYNNAYFTVNIADPSSLIHVVTDLVLANPNDNGASESGGYDYKLEVVADWNTILADVKLRRHLDTTPNQHESEGETPAYAAAHQVLNTGVATTSGATVTSFLTTMSDGDTTADTNWVTFWAGLLSEAIDSNDTDGYSVRIPELQTTLGQPTQTAAENDVIGGINDALGNNLFGGADNAKVDIDVAPVAATNYFMALLHFLYTHRGVSGLTGDPSDGLVGMSLLAGDKIALRISCTINHNTTGIILLEQSA